MHGDAYAPVSCRNDERGSHVRSHGLSFDTPYRCSARGGSVGRESQRAPRRGRSPHCGGDCAGGRPERPDERVQCTEDKAESGAASVRSYRSCVMLHAPRLQRDMSEMQRAELRARKPYRRRPGGLRGRPQPLPQQRLHQLGVRLPPSSILPAELLSPDANASRICQRISKPCRCRDISERPLAGECLPLAVSPVDEG